MFDVPMTPRLFLDRVLNGAAVGIVVGLIPNAITGELFKFLAARARAMAPLAHLVIYTERSKSSMTNEEHSWRELAAVGLAPLVGEYSLIEVDPDGAERYPALPLPPSCLIRRCDGGRWDMPDWSWLGNPYR